MEAAGADSMAAVEAGFTAEEAEASTEAGRLAGRGEGLADPGAVARSGARADSADLAEAHSADREAAIHSEVRAVSAGRAADRSEA